MARVRAPGTVMRIIRRFAMFLTSSVYSHNRRTRFRLRLRGRRRRRVHHAHIL